MKQNCRQASTYGTESCNQAILHIYIVEGFCRQKQGEYYSDGRPYMIRSFVATLLQPCIVESVSYHTISYVTQILHNISECQKHIPITFLRPANRCQKTIMGFIILNWQNDMSVQTCHTVFRSVFSEWQGLLIKTPKYVVSSLANSKLTVQDTLHIWMMLMLKSTMQKTTKVMKMTMCSEMVEVCLGYGDYLNSQIKHAIIL